MHYLPHEPAAEQRSGPRHLRVVGVVCDACGHEETEPNTRLEGWHRSDDGGQVLCHDCATLVATGDAVLFWLPCGHLEAGDAVLYDPPVCLICEQPGG
jgi:hypothetical protein